MGAILLTTANLFTSANSLHSRCKHSGFELQLSYTTSARNDVFREYANYDFGRTTNFTTVGLMMAGS